jgi:hypothetical protein
VAADPRNRAHALSLDREGWTKSMDAEMANHDRNQSWEWVPADSLPAGRKLVKFTWAYKVKRDGRLKSRLCVQGCTQTAGIDYDQTFSATLRSPSLRALAALAARNSMSIRRWDFVSAYLQGSLEDGEVLYCHAPPGYTKKDATGRDMICKVVKPIYGMAQAGRRWQRTLFPWLKEFGFAQCESDPCVFKCSRTMFTPTGPREEKIILGVYVDDLAVLYVHDDKHSLYREFSNALKEWEVEDEGEMHDLLGVEFSYEDKHVRLSQTQYINRLVAEHLSKVPTKDVTTPCDEKLAQHVSDALIAPLCSDAALLRRYQSLVGALLYCATNTRPDVAYSVGMLCRAMARPTETLMLDARRVLCYLHTTRHLGLRYAPRATRLYGMSDSDWAVKHSTSGYVFMLSHAAISWASKKQPSVALSSCEAELMAGSEAAKEAVYLSNLAKDLGVLDEAPVELFMDNKSAIDTAYNPQHHGRMKHVERRHYFIREPR